jgi:hypothetical protein
MREPPKMLADPSGALMSRLEEPRERDRRIFYQVIIVSSFLGRRTSWLRARREMQAICQLVAKWNYAYSFCAELHSLSTG